jgi:surface antigen
MVRMKRAILVIATLLACPPAAVAASEQQVAMLARLSDAEQSYHEKIFDYAMETVKPGESYTWESYGGKGIIAIGERFVSKSKSTCRSFTESFTAGGAQGSYEAIACKRTGKEGWCTLKKTDALTCAMERTSVIATGVPGVNIPKGNVDLGKPAGGVGSVGAPDVTVNGPDVAMPSQKEAGTSYADTVTGTAGNAAGPATGGAIRWFNDTFR